MSPFANQLKMLRMKRGLRQMELAEMLGYEQSYVSALELGLKGPPTDEFLNKLIELLKLSSEDTEMLIETVAASQRKLNIPPEAAIETYWVIHKLRKQIDRLHPAQVEVIDKILDLNMPLINTMADNDIPPRIKRRPQRAKEMEANM